MGVQGKSLVFFVMLSISVFLPKAFAQDHVYTSFFNDKALSGYDAVSYFVDEKPLMGDKRFVYTYMEARWYFSSQEHLGLFSKQPEKYAPQYGGYCAWAVGENKAFAAGDPKQWSLVDGKLYLNYSKAIKEKWLMDKDGFISKANVNWPEMVKN